MNVCGNNTQGSSTHFIESANFGFRQVAIDRVSSGYCSAKTDHPRCSTSKAPLPVDSSILIKFPAQHLSASPERAVLAPPLEPTIFRTVTARLVWCSVPFSPSSHSIEDRVEDGTKTPSGATNASRWVATIHRLRMRSQCAPGMCQLVGIPLLCDPSAMLVSLVQSRIAHTRPSLVQESLDLAFKSW
jgi:hypothetical protein